MSVLSPSRHACFFAKVKQHPNGCWQWTAALTRGYGFSGFKDDNGSRLAHRISWQHFVGPIPEGLQIDHLCRNKACVNPAHMELVTSKVNTLRGISPSAQNARKTHCPRGHAYDEANTSRWDGQRRCRVCHAEQQRAYRVRRAAA